MRRMSVLLVVCLLAGFVAVGLLWNGVDLVPPAPTAGPDDAPTQEGGYEDGAETATAESSFPPPDDDGQPEGQDPQSDAAPQRSEAAAEVDGRRAPRVRVVRGEPSVPVADAVVYYLTEAMAQQRTAGLGNPPSRFEWPTTWGQRSNTDADGVAQLPPTQVPWLAAAVLGDEFAFAQVPPGGRTVTMTLQTDETVTVFAVDADERPGANLPVALLQHLGRGDARTLWQGTTPSNGRAIVRHFQLLRQEASKPKDGQAMPIEGFAAVLLAPCAMPVVAAFAGRPATSTPVRLLVPPLGSVEVLLTDHRGTPLLSPALLGVSIDGAKNPTEPFAFSAGLLSQREQKPVGSAAVRLPTIGAGTSLRLVARFQGDRRSAQAGPVAGPSRGGEVVAVTLPLASHQVVLAGRLQGPDGAALGGAQVPVNLWRADRDVLGNTVHTIADGHFDLVLTARSDATEYWLELRHAVPAGPAIAGSDTGPRQLGARVRVPALIGGARLELGTIVLGELPPLVWGLIVDDRDQAVANAQVVVQQQEISRERNQTRESWRNLPQLATRTDDEGAFALCGRLPPGVLRVRADTDQHFGDSVPLHTLGQQVRIRIERNGILRGRAILPEWLSDGSVALSLRPFDESQRQTGTRSVDLQRRGGGRFVVQPLRMGRYDALVTVRNLREPVLVVPDVFVQPGETRDARLEQLDLSQSVFRHRLRAVDAAGQLLALNSPIVARLRAADGTVTDAGFRWQKGRAELISGSAMLDMIAFAPGCLPQQLTLGPGDHDVYMRQLAPARIELPGARALCGPTRRVRVSVIIEADTGHPQSLSGIDQRNGSRFSFARWDLGKSSGAWLEHSDTVEVPLMHSGRYEVVLRLHATESERSPQASIPLGSHELRTDGATFVPVRVPLDAAAVAAAIVSLEQRHQQQLEQQQRQQSLQQIERERNGNRPGR